MPRKPIDYSNVSMYKIEHIENESLVYVGHTTNFIKRKCTHKNNCKKENDKKFNIKLYEMIRNNGGWDMFKMVVIENNSYKDKREAEKRENELMKELKASMNTNRSFITIEELKEMKTKLDKLYRENNIEKIKEMKKQYRQNNIDKVKEKNKKYYENNKLQFKEKSKDYYKNNKEQIIAYSKDYYENNKDKIKEQHKEKTKCECGIEIIKINLKRHQTSKKHINLMNKINSENKILINYKC